MQRVIPDDAWGTLTLYGEARGEPYQGQVAVGEVIRARMARRIFSDGSVPGTVLRPRQFACWDDVNRIALGKVRDDDPAWISCAAAWTDSLAGLVTCGATHYLNPDAVLQAVGWLPLWAADPHDPKKLNESLVQLREGRHAFLKL